MNSLTAGQVVGFILLDLALIIVVARLVGGLFTRMGQPRVVGEMVAGVLLGPTLLGPALWPEFQAADWLQCASALAAAPPGTVQSPTWCFFPAQARDVLGGIGQLALLLFMFLAGLEVEAKLFKGRLKAIGVIGTGVVVIPLSLGLVIGPILPAEIFGGRGEANVGSYLYVGAMLAVTAFPVMVRILQERGLTKTTMGATGIASAALCTLVMFLATSAGSSLARGEADASLILRIGLSFLYLALIWFVARPLMARLARRYETTKVLDPGFFASIFLLLFVSGYIAHQLGLTVIVGGFVAGLALPVRKELFAEMSGMLGELSRTILLPVFLAFSGLSTDFTKLTLAGLGGIGLLLLAGIAGKWLGGAMLARLGGLSWREGNVLGVLMNCRGLLVLVVALEGVQAGVISGIGQLAGVAMALITTAMTGPLLDRFSRSLPEEPELPGVGTVPLVTPAS